MFSAQPLAEVPVMLGKPASMYIPAVTAGTYKQAGVPNLNGDVIFPGLGNETWESSHQEFIHTGVFKRTYKENGLGTHYDSGRQYRIVFNASDSNSIYGASTTVQPSALTLQFYIKF